MRKYLIDSDIKKQINNKIMKLSFGITFFLLGVLCVLGLMKIELSYSFFGKCFLTFSIFYKVCTWLFCKVLWNKPLFKKIHNVPDLNGIWEGELLSSFKDANGNGIVRKCTIKVKQNWDEISFKSTFTSLNDDIPAVQSIKADKSTSDSVNVAFNLDAIGGVSVSFDYKNFGNRSNKNTKHHIGFNIFTYREEEDILEGIYFTDKDRENQGDLQVKRITKKLKAQEA
ncbi:MAG: hypothetical protein ACRDDM_11245 [Paraclostridium sp.]